MLRRTLNRFEQKTVSLVTGARGIGLETGRQLAMRGHHVIFGVRNVEQGKAAVAGLLAKNSKTKKGAPLEFDVVELDATKPATVAAAAKYVDDCHGYLSALVNNAGVAANDDVHNLDVAEARRIFDVNFFGVIETTNHFLPLLKKAEAARIVNVTSIMGSLAEAADWQNNAFIAECKTTAYSCSKSALNMYTVQLARDLRKDQIPANAVHPGFIVSDMTTDPSAGMSMPGKPTDTVEFGAGQAVWLVQVGAKRGRGPTGGYFHNRLSMRW